MPSWPFTRRRNPGDKPALPPVAPKTPPAIAPQPKVIPSSTQARRAGDAPPDGRPLQLQFEEATATQARLRQDLAELLKAHGNRDGCSPGIRSYSSRPKTRSAGAGAV